MAGRAAPIARIRLARSIPLLVAWPAIVALTGVLAIVSWTVGSFGAGMGGIAFAVIGAGLLLVATAATAVLLSIRLDVHEASVRLSWLGGSRVYPLVPGPVTRVRLRGEGASSLRPRLGFFGWALGSARLRGEEDVAVVRLARTATAILVPTERGRLAIAAADEAALLDALSRAAHARQRREELNPVAPIADGADADPSPSTELAAAAPEPIAEAPADEPHVLTGIERALLEDRLADERAAAEPAAAEPAAPELPAVGEAPADVTRPAPAVGERARALVLRRPRPSAALLLLPMVGAGLAWAIGVVSGTYPDPRSDLARITAVALVLAGPVTTAGAILARTWWPRLVGVVVSGGLIASAFVVRGLLP